MKFIFKQGLDYMKYQKFEVEYSKPYLFAIRSNNIHDEIYNMIVLSILYNQNERNNPYAFEGFIHRHKRDISDSDTIRILYRPYTNLHTDIFRGHWSNRRGWHNDTFIISAELNWVLADEINYNHLFSNELNKKYAKEVGLELKHLIKTA